MPGRRDKILFLISSCINTPTLSRNRGGGGCHWGDQAGPGDQRWDRAFVFFKVVLNFVVSPSLQVKKWEKFGARSHGHSARSRGHALHQDPPSSSEECRSWGVVRLAWETPKIKQFCEEITNLFCGSLNTPPKIITRSFFYTPKFHGKLIFPKDTRRELRLHTPNIFRI